MRMNRRDLPLHSRSISRSIALLLPCLALSLALALPALADPPPTEGAKPAAPAPAPAKKPGSDKPKKLTRAEEKKALAALPREYRDWLEEVEVLITPEEKTAFLTLDKDYQRDSFIERFWEVRDKYHLGGHSAFKEQWDTRVEEAKTHFGNIKEDRSRILLLNGQPSGQLVSNCQLLWPMEVWYYVNSDRVRYEFFVIFSQRWGAGPYRIWEPTEGLGVLFRDSANPDERSLQAVADGCINGDKLAGAVSWVLQQRLGYAMLQAQFESRPEAPSTEWTATFHSYSKIGRAHV